MVQQTFNTHIKASREKVWGVLWDDRCYRIWTGVFSEDSHVVTNWKEVEEDYKDCFNDSFPKALELVRKLAEE